MSLDITTYKSGGTDLGRAEDGTYPARLTQVIGLGVQPMEDYQTGEPKDPKHRVILTFEFPTELINIGGEDKPRWYMKEYTLSNHEKAGIVKLVNALDPTGGTTALNELVGKPCMVVIGTTSSGKAKITGVTALMKGLEVAKLSKPPLVFDPSEPDLNTFNGFPDWLKEKLTTALNFQGSALEDAINNGASY